MLMLAQAHKQAIATHGASRSGRAKTKLADAYFTQVIRDIVIQNSVAAPASTRLDLARDQLRNRTQSLAAAHARLRRVVGQRTHAEADLVTCREHYAKLKLESNRLQRGLRSLTHQAINAQEAQSGRISRELRDNIAQTLIGINVRLLALKQSSNKKTADLTAGIRAVQRVAQASIATVEATINKGKTI